MALDPYSPCPCGSGKKLKFCCAAIVGEMDQVRRLTEGGQTQACLKKLDELIASHPGNAWVLNYRASLMLSMGQPSPALEDLKSVLEHHPDHQLALMLYANAALSAGGFETARPAVHRAFQKGIREMPDLVADLALNVAGEMLARQNFMAARQHLTFAIRFAPDDQREAVFHRLHEFDSNVDIPYPLRSVHLLANENIPADDTKDVEKARRLAEIGCWGPAAKVYAALSEKHPESAPLQQNLGLCRAWDGDQAGAATALHAAARLDADRFNAIECETVAQLLDRFTAEDRDYVEGWTFELNSVARALGRFETNRQFVKVPLDAEQQTDQKMVAFFQVLDRSTDGLTLTSESELSAVPNVVGHLAFYDRDADDDEATPQAYFTGFPGDEFAAAREIVIQTLGDELKSPPRKESDEREDSVAREERALFWRWFCPPGTPAVVRQSLEMRHWKTVLEDSWLNTPLKGLGGRSPREAAGSPEAEVPLLAALYVLDSFCNTNRYLMDFEGMCRLVGVAPPEPLDATEKTPITHFSAMQLKRINVKSLADEQLVYVSNRALMLHHGAFLYDTLTEVLSRPNCVSRIGDLSDIYDSLIGLSSERYRRDLAIEWCGRAREWATDRPDALQLITRWKLRELLVRLEDPADPQTPDLVREISERYGRKLPDVIPLLEMLLTAHQRESLIDTHLVRAGAPGPKQGLWTPGGEAAAGEPKKLWLPGQG